MSSQQQQQHLDDEYDEYNYDTDKYAAGSGHSGKCRTKKEAEQHTNRSDPGGHTRKTTQKLINSHDKEKEERKAHVDSADKSQQKKSCVYCFLIILVRILIVWLSVILTVLTMQFHRFSGFGYIHI